MNSDAVPHWYLSQNSWSQSFMGQSPSSQPSAKKNTKKFSSLNNEVEEDANFSFKLKGDLVNSHSQASALELNGGNSPQQFQGNGKDDASQASSQISLFSSPEKKKKKKKGNIFSNNNSTSKEGFLNSVELIPIDTDDDSLRKEVSQKNSLSSVKNSIKKKKKRDSNVNSPSVRKQDSNPTNGFADNEPSQNGDVIESHHNKNEITSTTNSTKKKDRSVKKVIPEGVQGGANITNSDLLASPLLKFNGSASSKKFHEAVISSNSEITSKRSLFSTPQKKKDNTPEKTSSSVNLLEKQGNVSAIKTYHTTIETTPNKKLVGSDQSGKLKSSSKKRKKSNLDDSCLDLPGKISSTSEVAEQLGDDSEVSSPRKKKKKADKESSEFLSASISQVAESKLGNDSEVSSPRKKKKKADKELSESTKNAPEKTSNGTSDFVNKESNEQEQFDSCIQKKKKSSAASSSPQDNSQIVSESQPLPNEKDTRSQSEGAGNISSKNKEKKKKKGEKKKNEKAIVSISNGKKLKIKSKSKNKTEPHQSSENSELAAGKQNDEPLKPREAETVLGTKDGPDPDSDSDDFDVLDFLCGNNLIKRNKISRSEKASLDEEGIPEFVSSEPTKPKLSAAQIKEILSQLIITNTFQVHEEHTIEEQVTLLLSKKNRLAFAGWDMLPSGKLWTKKEDEILLGNWEQFKIRYKFEDEYWQCFELNQETSRTTLLGFYRYLGQGLPKRPLQSIQRRFIHLKTHGARKQYAKYTEKENDYIREFLVLYRQKDKYSRLATILNRDRKSVRLHCLRLMKELTVQDKLTEKTLKYNLIPKEAMTLLIQTMMKCTKSETVEQLLKAKKIPWVKITKKLDCNPNRIYCIWTYYLRNALKLKEKVVLEQVVLDAVTAVLEEPCDEWLEVNWKKVAKKVKPFHSASLRRLVHSKLSARGDVELANFRELLERLKKSMTIRLSNVKHLSYIHPLEVTENGVVL